ncbi:MAG: sugar transferase [Romboutsia sp.]|uniref:sugar transferase n=1 Tax=Romboutsia sp. TaxID=1965302 RepID=UPI00216F7185|nr:sugar transferase [Romboutsia sp.]MCI9259592.1 sugar transferase [Romboutsia sp.]
MDNKFKFEEEFDDSAISIEIEHLKIRNSVFYLFIKRVLDFIGALIGLILLSPIMVIVAIAIKLEDPNGNIIFGHMRVGKDGKMFPCLKFRSMFSNAEEMKKNFTEEQKREYAETFKLKDDPRITKVGNFIRKTSLDELPQLFNILKGDMTIVGPRPIVTDELDFYGEYEDYYKAVKPGLTGLWQVSGRSDTTYDERVALDMEYVTTRNTFKDLYIIFMTAVKVLKREGSY